MSRQLRMLALVNVTKSHSGTVALGPVSLRFESGTSTAIVGTSGAGKSTLCRLLMGLDQPDTGCVLVGDTAVASEHAWLLARRRMGYVIQEGGLFPHLTVRDNVTLLARHVGWPRERIATRLGQLTQLVRLAGGTLARYPAELSGGERQRVGLMRALFLEPQVLLLDEPLGALDPVTRVELQRELHELFHRLGVTTVLVTHDLAEAAYLANDIVVIDRGVVQQRARFDELVRHPATRFVERLVGAQLAAAERLRQC